MCALFYENRLGIKKSGISFVYLFCPKFRVPYHSNHVIPHRVLSKMYFIRKRNRISFKKKLVMFLQEKHLELT